MNDRLRTAIFVECAHGIPDCAIVDGGAELAQRLRRIASLIWRYGNPWRYVERDGIPTEPGDYIVACAIDCHTYTQELSWSGTA